MTYKPGSITKWSRLGGALALVSIVLPEGPFRWAALSLAIVACVIAATRVPRQAWRTHILLFGSLACVVAAMMASEVLDLSASVSAWTVGVTGVVFVGVTVVSALRLSRRRREETGGI